MYSAKSKQQPGKEAKSKQQPGKEAKLASLVPSPPLQLWYEDWELDYSHRMLVHIALFPGPTQLSIACFSILQATESWAGPGNEARYTFLEENILHGL